MLGVTRRLYCPPRMLGRVMTLVAASLLIAPGTSRGNDGFYQGAGATLQLMKSKSMRVLRERLVISPIEPPVCVEVLVRGKPLPTATDNSPPQFHQELPADAITLDQPNACPAQPNVRRMLVLGWKAVARYDAAALEDVPAAQIGFPVPEWDFDYDSDEGLEGVRLPAVARFRTSIDGAEVEGIETRRLEEKLGYVWHASFKKGQRSTLVTRYHFGEVYSNSFYSGREYTTVQPWFLYGGQSDYDRDRWPGASSMIYYLTPMSSWADPPPESVSIRIDLPLATPVEYFVPVGLPVACVGLHELHFEILGAFPTADLRVSYPSYDEHTQKRPDLQTEAQWRAWLATLGGKAKLTCELTKAMKARADAGLLRTLGRVPCVKSCEARSGRGN